MDNCNTYEYYSEVVERKVDWLWYPYIPFGKITLLQGDPGEGKSSLIISLAALMTKGFPLPDGTPLPTVMPVIYQCAEDSVEDTIKPRLIKAGADCTKVAFIRDEDASVTLNDTRIEETIKATGAKLLVLDPIQAFIPPDSDMQSASQMRSVMRNLASIAERTKCAVVLVGHMNKSGSGKNLYRGLGSIDIAAIARSVLMVQRDSVNPQIRYMFPIKSNLAPEGQPFAFSLNNDTGFSWVGACSTDYVENEPTQAPVSKIAVAQSYLKTLLSTGPQTASSVFEHMQQVGISERTVRTAKKGINIKTFRKDDAWWWQIIGTGEHNGK